MSSFKPCLIMLALLFVVSKVCCACDDVRQNVGLTKILCPFTCRKSCPIIDTVIEFPLYIMEFRCHVKCRNRCKRSIPDFVNSEAQYIVQPVSSNFSHYDLNGDNLISLEEFSTAENLLLVEVDDVFTLVDTNKDYMLDISEFIKAPFVS